MILQFCCNLCKLFIYLRHIVFKLSNWVRCSYTCNNVLSLSVYEILSIQFFLSGGWITRKRNTCTGSLAHVTEYHSLNINSSTPWIRNIIHSSVNISSRVIPWTEHSFYRLYHLNFWVLREVFTFFRLIERLELLNHFLEVFSWKLGIKCDTSLLFHLINNFFKTFLWEFHNNIWEHLYKTAVTVISESLIVCLLSKTLNSYIV